MRGHLPVPIINGKEIAFENGRISDFQGLVTLTLNQVILHTVMHHSSTSAYISNFIEIEETFCGRTYVPTDGRTFETHFIRSTRRILPKNSGHHANLQEINSMNSTKHKPGRQVVA